MTRVLGVCPATLDVTGFEELVGQAAALARKDSVAAAVALSALQDEARRRSLPALEAECAYLHARTELDQGNLAEALVLIDTARDKWLEVGQPLSAARTGLGRMAVLDDLGRHADAIEVGHALIAAVSETLEGDEEQTLWIRAGALENLGVSYGYLGDHRDALAAHTEADRIYQQLGCADEMIQPRANRGVELLELGEAAAAIVDLRAAAVAFHQQDDQLFVAKCLAYEARAQLVLGNYLACMAATDRAEQLLDGQETTAEYARIQLVRADTLTSMNLLEPAHALYERLADQFSRADFKHDHAAAEAGRAVSLARLGRIDEGREAILRAKHLYRVVGDHVQASFSDVMLSEFLDDDAARVLVESTIPALRTGAHPAQLGAALMRSAQLEADDRLALARLDEVVDQLAAHDLPHLDWMQVHERGRRLHQLGETASAARAFREARASIDSMRATLDRDFERLPFMTGRDQVHLDAIALHLALEDVEEAYVIAEESRSRTLVEIMTGSLTRSQVAPTSELDDLYDKILRAPIASATDLRSSAALLEAEIVSEPVQRSTPSAIAAADLGTSIMYQILDDEVLAFVRDAAGVRVHRNLIRFAELRRLQARLDAQWRRFDDPGLAARQHTNLLSTVTALLQELFLALIAPLDVITSPSLVIVPHGALANLPFGAFHDGTCSLIERMPVTVAPSAAVAAHALQSLRERQQNQRRLVVGVASAETPHVEREVEAIGSRSNAVTLLNDQATVEAFSALVDSADVIHIASHGISRPDNPLFSGIQFADRWLTAGELAGLTLHGQLVVLSACSSGLQHGASDVAEVNGLPRALLAAGAAAVVVNLWPVEDAAAHQLMDRFHHYLDSTDAAEALRSAQLDIMRDLPHPYHWAPSVLIGAPTHLKDKS